MINIYYYTKANDYIITNNNISYYIFKLNMDYDIFEFYKCNDNINISFLSDYLSHIPGVEEDFMKYLLKERIKYIYGL